MSAMSLSRDGRIAICTAVLAPDYPHWAAVEEGDDVLDDLRVRTAVILLGYVADMRGQDHVRRRAQRMSDRQRLFVVDVEPGIGEASLLQRGDDRVGVADRPARRVDQDRGRFHQPD